MPRVIRRRRRVSGALDQGQRQHLAWGYVDFSGDGFLSEAEAEAAWRRVDAAELDRIRAEVPAGGTLWALSRFGPPGPRRALRLVRR